MTLGQEFGGFAANVAHAAEGGRAQREAAARAEPRARPRSAPDSTPATTTPTTRDPQSGRLYRRRGAARRSNRFRVTQSMGDVLGYSGALRRLASEVGKIASDLRLLSMGPRAGLAEIRLPAVQPGSSIMPGKVNPSVPEMVNQVCFQVFGCDATILAAAEAGQLELNVMMPVIAWNAIHATRILRQRDAGAAAALRRRHPGRRGALPRAARSQHRGRDRAQPVHRLRRDRRDRQDRGRDRQVGPRAGARTRAAVRRAARSRAVGRSDDPAGRARQRRRTGSSMARPIGQTGQSHARRALSPPPRRRRARSSTAGCSRRNSSARSKDRIGTRGSAPIR